MRFFRSSSQVDEAPCPRCCITIAMDARDCPYCGLNLATPEQTQDGWTAPVKRGEPVGPKS